MATLQYRPIDAPDFTAAMRGLQMSSGALNDAFSSAQNTLGLLRQQQTDTADREVLMRALAQQNASGMSNALADGSLLAGINPNRLSAGVLNGLQDRVGTLLNQDRTRQALETGAQNLEEARYGFGRTQDLNSRSDAARTAVNAITEAASRGDTNRVNALRQQYADVLGNLSGDQSTSLAQSTQGLLRGELGQRQGEFGLSRDQYNLGIAQRDDRESRAAGVIANNVLRMSANAEDARATLESMTGIDDNVRAQASRMVMNQFPGTYGPINAGTPSAPGAAGTRSGNPYDTTYQFRATDTPITQMKIGDVINHQSGMIRDQGHSPLGAFQINKATLEDFGPRVLGSNWRDQNFDAEAQNKLGEAIFNARKNGNLKDTWAALPDSRPGAYKDMSWNEVRQQISSAEVGQAVGASQPIQTNAAVTDLLTRAMQNNTTGVANDFAQTVNDTRDAGAIVAELTGEGGSFAGADRAVITRELNRVMNDGNVNAATAAAVLRRNIASSPVNPLEYAQYGVNRLLSPFRSTPNLGNGQRLNDEGVDATIQTFRDGSALNSFQANVETQAAGVAIVAAQQQYNDAVTALQQQTRLAATMPGLRAQLPRYQERVQAAQVRLEAAREAQRGLPQLRAQFERTRPEPVAESRGGGSSRTTEILRDAATNTGPAIPIPEPQGRSRGMNW